jgi:predicted RNA-binding protein with PIN domain
MFDRPFPLAPSLPLRYERCAMTHLIIDGYNVIRRVPSFLRAEREGLESGRSTLLLALEDYASAHGYGVTVVFDGGSRPREFMPALARQERFAGIDLIFSERGETADTAIVRLVEERRSARQQGIEHCEGDDIVVSDDYAIRDEVLEHGAFVMAVQELFKAMQQKQRLHY